MKSRSRGSIGWSFALTCAVAAVSSNCRTATAITVDVTTDVDCPRISDTTIAVAPPGAIDGRDPAAATRGCASGHIGSLVVTPSGADDDILGLRVVAGLDGKSAEQCARDGFVGGCIVARRALRYLPHESLRVPVVLRAACRDVVCPAQGGQLMTCVDGACVPATIGDPSACEGNGCGENVLADGGVDATTRDGSADASDGSDAEAGAGAWVAMADIATISLLGRSEFACAWGGGAMYVWGGWWTGGGGAGNDGASYDPSLDKWTALPAAPLTARPSAHAHWTGSKLIVWGGTKPDSTAFLDGAVYDPSPQQWAPMAAPPGTFVQRASVATVWSTTTQEMIAWGGADVNSSALYADGVAYKPSTNTWRTIAASTLSARGAPSAVWTGTTMVVFGGVDSTPFPNDAAAYDPMTDMWTQPVSAGPAVGRDFPNVAATSDGRALFWGGGDHSDHLYLDGVLFDARAAAAAYVPQVPGVFGLLPREAGVAWFGAGRFWFWGGAGPQNADGGIPLHGDGASFDPQTARWTVMPPGGPSARAQGCAVWTGTEAIVWGGEDGTDSVGDGKRFRP
jgi:N-acetylneuraminic acid mutarotase